MYFLTYELILTRNVSVYNRLYNRKLNVFIGLKITPIKHIQYEQKSKQTPMEFVCLFNINKSLIHQY